MLLFLALVGASPEQPFRAQDLFARALELPMELYDAARIPSGTALCDQAARRRQTHRFDRRYGRRLNAVARAMRAVNASPWPAGQIQLADCYPMTPTAARSALDRFDAVLGALEVRYGIAPGGAGPAR